MGYNDLKIAIKRREKLKQKENLQLKERDFKIHHVDDFLEISLPSQAIRVDQNVLKIKYPNVTKATEVFIMPDESADFLFQIDDNTLVTQEQASDIKESTKRIVMRLQPANTFHMDGTESVENMNIRWFDFDSFGLDGMIYNLLFFTSVQGCLCTGSFHCEGPNAVDWKAVFLKVLNSFKELEVCDES